MSKIFQYFGLATAVIESISGIQSALKSNPVSGAAIQAAVEPAIDAVTGILAHVVIPGALITDVCNAAADAINQYFEPKA